MIRFTIKPADLALVLAEWERRYRENPEEYMSEATKLLRETPESTGEAGALYIIQLAKELGVA